MINVGIVGVGGISRSHLNAYKEIEGVRLVAAADIQGEDAKNYELASEMGVKFYTSLDDMLAGEKLDMLDVCTPTSLHKEMVVKGLEAGLHVISEKPMGLTSSECLELCELSRRVDKLYMVAHVVRFMKPYIYLRSFIESGELGAPVHLFLRRLSTVPRWSYQNWMQDVSLSGGAPLDLSIHDIDFVYSIFGEPREVSATYRSYSGKDAKGLNDYISSELIYDGFSASIIGAQYNADIQFTAEYIAVFEGGVIELRQGKVYKCGEEISLDEVVKEEKTGINISSSGAYTDEIACFVDSILHGKRDDFVSPESSMGSVKLVERLVSSAIRI